MAAHLVWSREAKQGRSRAARCRGSRLQPSPSASKPLAISLGGRDAQAAGPPAPPGDWARLHLLPPALGCAPAPQGLLFLPADNRPFAPGPGPGSPLRVPCTQDGRAPWPSGPPAPGAAILLPTTAQLTARLAHSARKWGHLGCETTEAAEEEAGLGSPEPRLENARTSETAICWRHLPLRWACKQAGAKPRASEVRNHGGGGGGGGGPAGESGAGTGERRDFSDCEVLEAPHPEAGSQPLTIPLGRPDAQAAGPPAPPDNWARLHLLPPALGCAPAPQGLLFLPADHRPFDPGPCQGSTLRVPSTQDGRPPWPSGPASTWGRNPSPHNSEANSKACSLSKEVGVHPAPRRQGVPPIKDETN
uniref:translation initiation factor IF-2-like n=1 Tax=Halichoerus grypus TaxID=9711 RepID=UPI001658F09B|nr:translation initiation factor IF-2-like [Halichoerus grypus]